MFSGSEPIQPHPHHKNEGEPEIFLTFRSAVYLRVTWYLSAHNTVHKFSYMSNTVCVQVTCMVVTVHAICERPEYYI